jgi:hypothetical protein
VPSEFADAKPIYSEARVGAISTKCIGTRCTKMRMRFLVVEGKGGNFAARHRSVVVRAPISSQGSTSRAGTVSAKTVRPGALMIIRDHG